MNFIMHKQASGNIAELQSKEIFAVLEDFLDIIGNANYQEIEKVIMLKQNFHSDFFDLKTKLAGDVLQKFSTYRIKLAIVGNFSNYKSKSLQDFIKESNKLGHILFTNSVSEAIEKL